MMARRLIASGLAAAGFLAMAPRAGSVPARPAAYREGFESARPAWRQEETDLTVRLGDHDRTERARHEGRRSERIAFSADGPGSALYYSFPLPRIPLAPDLEVSLYARSNIAGQQLLARIVLPADTDPDTGQASFLLVAGTISDDPDRWERLELTDVPRAAEAQARILRIKTGRKIDLEGAYLERLVVNLYGGPGDCEVFLDDLAIAPVPEELASAPEPKADEPGPAPRDTPPAPPPVGGEDARAAAASGVELKAGRLVRGGHDWVPSILSAPGADLAVALPFGFDVVEVDPAAEPAKLRAVRDRGALLMPDLSRAGSDEAAIQQAAAFPVPEAVAFWKLGEDLGAGNDPEVRKEQLRRVRAVRSGLGGRLATGLVAGDFAPYASPGRGLDLMGVDAHSWASSRDPWSLYQYLSQRRQLTALFDVGLPFWARIDAAPAPEAGRAVWGDDLPPAWGAPRVQPEQVRVATYLALMAGYRGVEYRADAGLSRPAGRAILYELGLLNAEIDLVESILARGVDPIVALPTYPPDPKRVINFGTSLLGGAAMSRHAKGENSPLPEVNAHDSIKAAVVGTRDRRTRLILVADAGEGGQFQPGQMAIHDLKVRVPGAADSAQVLELSLGGAKWLPRVREPGGVHVTIPEFGTSALLLLTTDYALADRMSRAIEAVRPQAVDLAIKQARLQYDWVAEIHARLVRDGHPIMVKGKPTDEADGLLRQAAASIESAEQARAREDYALAWDEARRAGRPLRILMRVQWDQARVELNALNGLPRPEAIRDYDHRAPHTIVPPAAAAPLLSFNTLPQFYVWLDWFRSANWGPNLLPAGAFDDDDPAAFRRNGWADASRRDERIESKFELRESARARGKTLVLTVAPADPKAIDRLAAFLDQPAAAVRTPPVPVKARQMVRIRVRLRLPRKLPPGAGGLIVRDSIGGERLQYRTTESLGDWTELVLYRRVPADADLTVTLGLAGYGTAYFDDLRIDAIDSVAGVPINGGELVNEPTPARGRASPAPPAASLPPGRTATHPVMLDRSPVRPRAA